MRFIQTGHDDEKEKTFINLDNITKIDFYPKCGWPHNRGRLQLQVTNHMGAVIWVEEGELGYEEIKKLLIP